MKDRYLNQMVASLLFLNQYRDVLALDERDRLDQMKVFYALQFSVREIADPEVYNQRVKSTYRNICTRFATYI